MNSAFLLITFLSSSMDFLFTGIKQLDVQCFVASVLVMCCQYCWKCKCENKNKRKDFKPKFSLWRQTIDISIDIYCSWNMQIYATANYFIQILLFIITCYRLWSNCYSIIIGILDVWFRTGYNDTHTNTGCCVRNSDELLGLDVSDT